MTKNKNWFENVFIIIASIAIRITILSWLIWLSIKGFQAIFKLI